ncbi:hypothetical protein EOL96_02680 [Candidatus Saccharibacteria bacterium]|nr:hypothetical protein [Candidatus Saccharibacteria bacterium]
MKPRVFVFRGAPASGKGTVVPVFAKTLQKPAALIEQDRLRWGFHLIGREVHEITPDEHRFAYENTLLLFERYLKSNNYNIIVEGLFTYDDNRSNQGSVTDLQEIANRYNYNVTSIVLRADKDTLRERNNKRAYTVSSDEFNDLYESIYKKIGAEELVIDTTTLSINQTIAKILTATKRN